MDRTSRDAGRYSDLDRPPLAQTALRRALVDGRGPWTDVRVVARTTSTNADVAALARAGAPSGLVLVAETQTAGRGRLDRSWTAPSRSGLTFSVLLRPPDLPPARWGWLPLLTGLAVAEAVGRVADVTATVKWPNDVLVGERKLAGILAERVGDAVVIGVGLNVSLREDELPVPQATSVALAGGTVTDRDTVLRGVLRAIGARYVAWAAAADDAALRTDYLAVSATVGRDVRVVLPGERELMGSAADVDADGRLVLDTGDGMQVVGAGDVVHVRPAG